MTLTMPFLSRLFRVLFFFLTICFFFSAPVSADDAILHMSVDNGFSEFPKLELAYRLPETELSSDSPILVLFGGRNWPGQKTIERFSFGQVADKFHAMIISPSFHDHEYWQPEDWSGNALFHGIDELKSKYKLTKTALYYYGYSAGAQCANLFYAWQPEDVKCVAMHACGVWSETFPQTLKDVPFLVTCGEADFGRFQLSYTKVQQLRESGVSVIFKNNSGGHELDKNSLALAYAFFDDVLSGKSTPAYITKDFEQKYYLPQTRQAAFIDKEVANYFLSETTLNLWLNANKQAESTP